jgi:uroporphyrinogen-III synthase
MSENNTVFISRSLPETSDFRIRLESLGWQIIDQTLIEITPVNFELDPDADWIFFSSPSGVRSFFSIHKNPGKVRLACLGPGTARTLESYGYTASFIGDGEPQNSSAAFLKVAANQRVLFPRASQSLQSIQKLLGTSIQIREVIAYENVPRKNFQIPEVRVLVFTSPMNARSYFDKYPLKTGQAVVAIGQRTANQLNALGIPTVHIATDPSEAGLAEVVVSLP